MVALEELVMGPMRDGFQEERSRVLLALDATGAGGQFLIRIGSSEAGSTEYYVHSSPLWYSVSAFDEPCPAPDLTDACVYLDIESRQVH